MLTPDYLDSCSDYLLGMYDALNQSIAEDIARRIVKTGQMTDSAKWQMKQSRENGALMQDIVKDVARVSGKSESEIKRLFQDSARTGVRYDADPLVKAGYGVDLKLSPAMAQTLNAAIAKTNGDIRNLTMTAGSTTSNLYLEATQLAYMKVTSGGFSYIQAIRDAVRQAAADGGYVLYGKGSKTQLDVAIRRSVLTGLNQTAAKLTEQYSESMDAEYYETTAHAGARPSHSEWQGKVFKIRGSTPDYPNFYEATGYGTGAGLCGWNCRHSFYPYWPGISKPAYTKDKLDGYDAKRFDYGGEKLTDYECSQMQRAYERQIREYKRILASYDAAINAARNEELERLLKEEFQKESVKLKTKEKELKSFCKDTNRSYDSARTQVVAYKDSNGRIVNFGRSTAQKAVWANKKS
jgi:AraC-like DNA-binding protein